MLDIGKYEFSVLGIIYLILLGIFTGNQTCPPGAPFYAPGSPFHAPRLLYCDHGASFCALGSTFCTPTNIIYLIYQKPIFFLMLKDYNFDYDNEFDESGIVCLEGI